MSAEEVATAIGVTLEEYLKVEAEGELPPARAFLELVSLLGVNNPHWLVQGDPPDASPPNNTGNTGRFRVRGKR